MIDALAGPVAGSLAKSAASKGLARLWTLILRGRSLAAMSLWNRNGRARVAIAAILRLQSDDGCFVIMRNLHRPEEYSPLGGVFKCRTESGYAELDKFEFVPENRMVGDDIARDLRGYTKRKHVAAILKWFGGSPAVVESGEGCLRRELKEELTEETAVLKRGFNLSRLSFAYSHKFLFVTHWSHDQTDLTQAQLFFVYDLNLDQSGRQFVRALKRHAGEDIIWVSRNDVLNGRCSKRNKPIGSPCELFIRPRISRPGWPPPNLQA